jgi:DNA-binding GntR family transcriptional regulator
MIAAHSGNRLVQETLANLHTHVHLFRLIFRSGTPRATIAEHEEILGCIRRHDAKAAELAMCKHLEESAKRFKDAVM